MGLDTSHDCYHGTCHSFNQYRGEIASLIGISLFNMEGFGGDIPWPEHHEYEDLFSLLNHSDCDGEISFEEAKRLHPALLKFKEEFEVVLPEDLEDFIDNWIMGVYKAIQAREAIDFH